jgi:hypothetical protein
VIAMPRKMTKAAVLVAGLAKRVGASRMARKLGLSEAAIRLHSTGESRPRGAIRDRYAKFYDVPIEAWTSSPKRSSSTLATPTSPVAELEPVEEGELDARKVVIHLLGVARAQLEAARREDSGYQARAQLITAATGLCRLLARLSGQLEVSEVAIVRSPAWARAMRIVREVLERHEGAAAELDVRLATWAEGGT